MQGDIVAAHLVEILTIKPDRAFARPLGKMREFQQGAFAGAGVACDKHHFPGLHGKTQIIQRLMAAWIFFTDAIKAQKSHRLLPVELCPSVPYYGLDFEGENQDFIWEPNCLMGEGF